MSGSVGTIRQDGGDPIDEEDPVTDERTYLEGMVRDTYFPPDLVEKGQAILRALDTRLAADRPADLEALYTVTHAATEEFNALNEEFWERGSEIETVARDVIATDFLHIARAHGFTDADIEELVAPRDW
ncbi:DUF5713 family protein [Nocardiopsis flavescens]|uniref:DUF5713 family protein n=1 Tax=Nocardiopsis flavescens TaxID=758803 RepID=UPI003652A00B